MGKWVLRAGAVALGLGLLAAALLAPCPCGTTRIVSQVDIARPPEEVYAYVTTPGHWPQWHPSSLAVAGATDHSLRIGEEVVEDYRVAGRTGRATWRVVARDEDRLWRIDGTIGGRAAGVVTYIVAPSPGGAHFEREFSYGSPNLLFALLNAATLRRRIDEESRLALARLKARLEQGAH